MPTVLLRHRLRIVVGVFMGLIVHTVEIWLFGLVYYLMHQMDGWGWLTGSCDGSLLDCVYF